MSLPLKKTCPPRPWPISHMSAKPSLDARTLCYTRQFLERTCQAVANKVNTCPILIQNLQINDYERCRTSLGNVKRIQVQR